MSLLSHGQMDGGRLGARRLIQMHYFMINMVASISHFMTKMVASSISHLMTNMVASISHSVVSSTLVPFQVL